MAKLTIKGDLKHLKVIAKRSRLNAAKYGLKIKLLGESSKEEAEEVEEIEEVFVNAKDTIALIEEATSLEELAAYEGDERKTVQQALESKKEELAK